MVQTYSAESSFDLPWSVLAHAYLLRYPNPFAKHVLSLDVLDRRILHRNPQDPPVLLTSRLLLKRGTLPSWAPRGLIKNAESWVLEVTEVDLEPSADPPRRRQMRTWTRNLDHTTVLAVAESMTFTEGADAEAAAISDFKGKSREPSTAATSAADQSPIQTHCITSAHITSNVSVLWKRIEKFGLKRFKAHIDTVSHTHPVHWLSVASQAARPKLAPAADRHLLDSPVKDFSTQPPTFPIINIRTPSRCHQRQALWPAFVRLCVRPGSTVSPSVLSKKRDAF